MNKLKGRLAHGDGFIVVRLEGVIDDHNELARLTGAIGQGDTLPAGGQPGLARPSASLTGSASRDVATSLLIDLGGIKRLNSVGVRDWVNWLRGLRERFKTIVLFDCPPPVMTEVNFVKNFAEGVHITTFAVPLFCARCNKEETRLIETASIRGTKKLPSFACVEAACENVLDDDEESYLSFLDGLPASPDPGRLMQLTISARAAVATAPTLESNVSRSAERPPLKVGQAAHAARPVVSPPAVPERAEGSRGDWLFMAAMAAMVAVLGVLVYLILTLE